MKFILTLAVAFGLAINSFATGAVPINSPQSGVANFTATNSVVVDFVPDFTQVPVVALFGSVTNLTPITNSVTATNMTITIAATNASAGGGWGSVAWSANLGYPRIQFGTNGIQSQFLVTNTFATPYAQQPIVTISGTALTLNGTVTNAIPVLTVTNITTTGFVISYPTATPSTNQTVYWQAFGISATPGTSVVTY